MKIILKLLTLFLVMLMTANVFAEDSYKFAVIDIIKVIKSSPQADKAREMIEKEFSPRKKELLAAQKNLIGLQDKLKRDSAIMNDQARTKLEREIVSSQRDLKRSQDEYTEDFNYRNNEELLELQKRVIAATQEFAQQNNYDIVWAEGMIYTKPKFDITNMVIEHLKKSASNSEQ